jgi:ABC-2 type transport system ATP-binding protein
VEGVTKRFGTTVALAGVDLDVAEGTVFGLLGPNGAGKTTLIRVLATLLAPDAGHAHVFGRDVVREAPAVRETLGLTGQFAAVDEILTGRENLEMFGRLFRLSREDARRRAAELLERFDLADAGDRPARTYSGGMRRRLDLAMGLVGSPRIVFLDEPTAGLDPRSRQTMWQIVRDLVADGVTIFLTTQYLDEADHLADRIAVLDHGTLVAEGTAAELKRLIPGGHVSLQLADADALGAAALAFGEATVNADQLTIQVPCESSTTALRALLDRIDAAAVAVDALSVHSPDLDDVFLALTDRPGERASTAPPASTATRIKETLR